MQFDLLHVGTLVALAHILGVVAACHAILNTRTSQGAIAWAVSLVAMPYLTLVPYLFLGRSKFAGYADARRVENELLRTRAHPPEWDTRASSAGRAPRAVGGPAHAGARRQARAFAHAPRRHAVSARQLGTHAGERRGDLRGHLRSDRE